MTSLLRELLSHSKFWTLSPVFLIVALESSAFLGLLFPGEAVALAAGGAHLAAVGSTK